MICTSDPTISMSHIVVKKCNGYANSSVKLMAHTFTPCTGDRLYNAQSHFVQDDYRSTPTASPSYAHHQLGSRRPSNIPSVVPMLSHLLHFLQKPLRRQRIPNSDCAASRSTLMRPSLSTACNRQLKKPPRAEKVTFFR